MIRSLPKVVAAFLLTASSAFGAPEHGFPFDFPRFRIGMPRFSIEFGGCRPVHQHCYTYTWEREWVPPIYDRCLAGFDCAGRPIYRTVLVRAGYWTSVRYRVCHCGLRARC